MTAPVADVLLLLHDRHHLVIMLFFDCWQMDQQDVDYTL